MTETTTYRLSKVAKDLNIGLDHVVESLNANGVTVEKNPNAKINQDAYNILLKEFSQDKAIKEASDIIASQKVRHDAVVEKPKETESKKVVIDEDDNVSLRDSLDKIKKESVEKAIKAKREEAHKDDAPKVDVPKVDTPIVEAPSNVAEIPNPEPVAEKATPKKETKKAAAAKEEAKAEPVAEPEVHAGDDVIRAKAGKIDGPTILGNIVLPDANQGKGKKKKADKSPDVETPAPVAEEKKNKGGKKKKEEELVEEVKLPVAETIEPVVADELSEPTVADADADKPAGIETMRMETKKLSGPNIVGKIVLPTEESKRKPAGSSSQNAEDRKRKRKRTDKRLTSSSGTFTPGAPGSKPAPGTGQRGQNPNAPGSRPPHKADPRKPFVPNQKVEPTDKEIQDQIKATLQKLSGGGKSRGSKLRREKRTSNTQRLENAEMEEMANKKIQVTEFVTANELSKLLGVNVTQIISTCMSLGMFVSINQRLDAETLTLVAEEFGHEVEFVSAEVQEAINDTPDAEEDLIPRAPIVTVMGHVDHGKTSLLDYVRSANVIAGEAGGITQHIGAYEVTLPDGRAITFLDTPGHEAFTAMRARGAKVTDVAIIVIAADDSVMPQTIEAINHAQAAGVPIVFAFNKMDKPDSAPDRIREQLSKMNILVEEWGGKFQTQEISAKKGLNIDKLLDKVLLEAEILDLKANPKRNAKGTVIEATLDKGRGYVTTMLVQTGTIKTGDILLAGCHSGRVKAMFNERGQKLDIAGPSTPVMLLGLSGAPQAGDQFNVMDDEREAREIANKRLQLQREQGLRTHKHITLDEIGRRLAIGNFKELNVIVKGDVDGSVEALADSLIKLGTEEIQVNVIHKSVGQISESDVLLASASNAIVIGFQVRPSVNARKLAEAEQIDIRLYSIIYNAIAEIKSAMEGMLAPEFEEKIVCNIEIRETFKIPKVGTIAGCMVLDGKVTRNTKVRVVRDGIVMHSGELASLKRFKDDVKEVLTGYECGLNLASYNDIQIGDIIEGYEQVAVKRTLA